MNFFPIRLPILAAYCVNAVNILPDFFNLVDNRNREASGNDGPVSIPCGTRTFRFWELLIVRNRYSATRFVF